MFTPIIRLTVCLTVIFALGCTRKEKPLGTAENPLKFFFVPSVDAKLLEASGEKVKAHLEKVTPYSYYLL